MTRGSWQGRPSWVPYPPASSVSTSVRWLALDSPTETYAPGGAVAATINATDADGWTDVTITGTGSVLDGYNEQRCLIYDVPDIHGDAVDFSDGNYRLLWRHEIESPSLDADALFQSGVVVFTESGGLITGVQAVTLYGYSPDTGGLRQSALLGTSLTNTTSAITGGVRADCSWMPERGASPELGLGGMIVSNSSGVQVGTVRGDAVGVAVTRSNLWRFVLALGHDSTSTTPVTLRQRVGVLAVSLE